MRILILLLFCLNITYVKADEIYNLLKIPNLEIFKLKSKNNIRYLNSNNDFKIGVDDNITCKKTKKINLDKKFPVIEKNLSLYNSNFLKKNSAEIYSFMRRSIYFRDKYWRNT